MYKSLLGNRVTTLNIFFWTNFTLAVARILQLLRIVYFGGKVILLHFSAQAPTPAAALDGLFFFFLQVGSQYSSVHIQELEFLTGFILPCIFVPS